MNVSSTSTKFVGIRSEASKWEMYTINASVLSNHGIHFQCWRAASEVMICLVLGMRLSCTGKLIKSRGEKLHRPCAPVSRCPCIGVISWPTVPDLLSCSQTEKTQILDIFKCHKDPMAWLFTRETSINNESVVKPSIPMHIPAWQAAMLSESMQRSSKSAVWCAGVSSRKQSRDLNGVWAADRY